MLYQPNQLWPNYLDENWFNLLTINKQKLLCWDVCLLVFILEHCSKGRALITSYISKRKFYLKTVSCFLELILHCFFVCCVRWPHFYWWCSRDLEPLLWHCEWKSKSVWAPLWQITEKYHPLVCFPTRKRTNNNYHSQNRTTSGGKSTLLLGAVLTSILIFWKFRRSVGLNHTLSTQSQSFTFSSHRHYHFQYCCWLCLNKRRWF